MSAACPECPSLAPRCRCDCGCDAHSHYRRCRPCARGMHVRHRSVAVRSAYAFGAWGSPDRLAHIAQLDPLWARQDREAIVAAALELAARS